MRKVELLFDTVRSPYDIAHIIQVAQSIDCVVYTAGKNSIPFNHHKVIGKIKSWNIRENISEIHYDTLDEAVTDLRSRGKFLLGTSGNADTLLYTLDLPEDRDIVLVFGTEASGLSSAKQESMDKVVKLPMDNSKVDFLTLPVAVSVMAYELYRRYNFSDGRYCNARR